jgi:prolyl-tRNA synthetase
MAAVFDNRARWCELAFDAPDNDEAIRLIIETANQNVRSYRGLPRVFFRKSADHAKFTGLIAELPDSPIAGEVSSALADFVKNFSIRAIPAFPSALSPLGAFHSPDPRGGAELVLCEKCGLAQTPALAPSKGKRVENPIETPMEVSTPGIRTIEQVASFFQLPPERFAKSLLMMAGGKPALAMVRGDDMLSVEKFSSILDAAARPAAPEEVFKHAGVEPGFVGPLGNHRIPIYIDSLLENAGSFITGAGKSDFHVRGLVPGRDFETVRAADIREGKAGDACPICGSTLSLIRGETLVSSARIFQDPGERLVATDSNGKETSCRCVSFEIAIGNILFALFPEERTRTPWALPNAAAPFDAHVILLNAGDAPSVEIAGRAAGALKAKGLDFLLDDRAGLSPGEKFNDADLIGIPLRIVIGKKKAVKGLVEIRRIAGAEVKTADVKISGFETGNWGV